jgi:OmpA-OmpF porin, OOP family
MSNLLDALKGYITPELISKASGMLGESENGTTSAITAALPTLLSGLVNKSGDSGFMGTIMDMVSQNSGNSGGIMSNLSGLLSPDNASSGVASGLLSSLFGTKLGGISDLIAGVSGVKSSSVGSILAMAGPMLLSHLGNSGTTASGLSSMLSSQKDSILAASPAGLSSLMGFSSNTSNTETRSSATIPATGSSSGFPKWLFPLLAIAAALVALYYFSKSCNKTPEVPAIETSAIDSLKVNADAALDSTTTAVGDAATTAVADVSSTLGSFFKFKLPNGVELNTPQKGIENQVVTWMNDKSKIVDKTTWFNFDRLLFETGKSTLKPESQEQLKNMSEIMKAYPTMEVKLGGYTDNTGNAAANLKLSGERAKSVSAELVKMGVAATRVASEGYGDQFPVASNDTEEGRAQNRRIAVRVTKK